MNNTATITVVPRNEKGEVCLFNESDRKQAETLLSKRGQKNLAQRIECAQIEALIAVENLARSNEFIAPNSTTAEWLNNAVTAMVKRAVDNVQSAEFDRILIENTPANREALNKLFAATATNARKLMKPGANNVATHSMKIGENVVTISVSYPESK